MARTVLGRYVLRLSLVFAFVLTSLPLNPQWAFAAATPPTFAQEEPPPGPEVAPALAPVAAAPDAAGEVVEHWRGTGFEREESLQVEHNRIGDCWFCSFSVIERRYEVDIEVFADGTLKGTIKENYSFSYHLIRNHCLANRYGNGHDLTYKLLDCRVSHPSPSGTVTWQIAGTRFKNSLGELMQFDSALANQVHKINSVVSGCEWQVSRPCKPYYYAGHTQGLMDIDQLTPPPAYLKIDVDHYGRPAVVFDDTLTLVNPYSGEPGYHTIDRSWRLFELGERPTLSLDQELLARSVFMNGVPLTNLLQAKPRWSSSTGGSTRWALDQNVAETPVSAEAVIPRNFDVGALPVAAHPLSVVGTDTLGRKTNEVDSSMVIAPLIKLCGALGYTASKVAGTADYRCSLTIPEPALEAEIEKMPEWFPYLGGSPFGVKETQAGVQLEVKSTGEGSLKGFGQTGFDAMGGVVVGSLAIAGDVVLLPTGARIPSGSLELGLSGSLSKEKPLVEVIPQLAAAATTVGKVSPMLAGYLKDLAKLGIEFSPSMTASPKFKNEDGGDIEWISAEVSVGAGLKFYLTLDLVEDLLELQASVGGDASLVIVLPPSPDYLKSVDAKIAAVFKLKYWKFTVEGEKAYAWSSASSATSAAPADVLAATADPAWKVIDRAYLAEPDYAEWVGPKLTQTVAVDFPLMNNAGPLIEPAVAPYFNDTTFVWSQERTGLPATGADELVFQRSSLLDWSKQPVYLTDDNQADWNPQVVSPGGGDTMIVWQRMNMANPGDLNTNGPAFLSHSQVMAGFLDQQATTIAPVLLSDDISLNHRPQVGATYGGAMALWVKNPWNLLVGDTAHPDTLLSRNWNLVTQQWSTPTVAVPSIPGVIELEFASAGTQAAALYTFDQDGSLATPLDRELYAARYIGGAWAAPARLTNNSDIESDVELVLASDGSPRAVWRAGNQFYYLDAWAGAPVALPFTPDALAGNLTLAALEQGALALLWTQPEQGSEQIFVAAYSPASKTWSHGIPANLPAIGGTAHGASTIVSAAVRTHQIWLGQTNAPMLMIAYNEAALGTTTRTVTAFNGAGVTPNVQIPDSPVTGKYSLRMAWLPLPTNLSLTPADVVVTPPSQNVGGPVTVAATVRNTGFFAVQPINVALTSFPNTRSITVTQYGTQTIPFLRAGDQQTVHFTIPRPAIANQIFTVKESIASSPPLREADENDNIAFVGTDAAITATGPTIYQNRTAVTSAFLTQQSALPIPGNMEVGLRLGSPFGPLLATTSVAMPVDPGAVITASATISVPTLGPGRHTVYWQADPTGGSGDWNPANDFGASTIVVMADLEAEPMFTQLEGDAVRVVLSNDGTASSPATSIGVFDLPPDQSGAVQVASLPVPPLQPGQVVKVEGGIVMSASGSAVPRYIKIDPQNLVSEIDETSNSVALELVGDAPPVNVDRKLYLPTIRR